MNAYSISKLAEDAGVSVHVVRDYLMRGLLHPAWRTEGGYNCHFQKTTARNIRSQPHDLLRCQLGRPLTSPKSQANVGVRDTSCYALHPG